MHLRDILHHTPLEAEHALWLRAAFNSLRTHRFRRWPAQVVWAIALDHSSTSSASEPPGLHSPRPSASFTPGKAPSEAGFGRESDERKRPRPRRSALRFSRWKPVYLLRMVGGGDMLCYTRAREHGRRAAAGDTEG